MQKEIEILAKYEPWFHSAVYADYMRALWQSDFDILIPIYEKWTGVKADGNMTCSKCKLNFIRKLGKLYYKNKEEYEKQSKYTKGESHSKEREEDRQHNPTGTTNNKQQSKRSCNTTGQRCQPKANKNTKK